MSTWKHNYHSHTTFSDGKHSIKKMVQSAINAKLISLGISDHSPVPIESNWNMKSDNVKKYLKEIKTLSENNNTIELFAGIEIDFLKGEKPLEKQFLSQFDYTIGSLHYIKTDNGWNVIDKSKQDFIDILNTRFNGNINTLFTNFSTLQCEMIEMYKPDILGHIDLITKFNQKINLFDETDKKFLHSMYDVIEVAKAHNTIIEINTGAISRGYKKVPYPSIPILKRCIERDIRLVINSDAHNQKGINSFFDSTLSIVKECGVKELWHLKKGKKGFISQGI